MSERVWEGSASLERLLVPVDHLVRHPRNPRRGKVADITESLQRFGQTKPVLTDGAHIVAGNHTYQAAVELGWTHVAAISNDFGSDEEARAYMLADNRLPELGGYDDAQLLELLAELEAADGWTGTGYSADDLDDLRALQDAALPIPDNPGFGVSPDELEARRRALAEGRTLSEVVLLLTRDQETDFSAHVKVLQKHYGGKPGLTETVSRAVADAAARDAG